MAKDECPHCGEPIDEEATFCRHCGSDAETGWNPDAEYLSLELPEDDEENEAEGGEEAVEPAPEDVAERFRGLVGPALVVGAWVFFCFYGYATMRPQLLVLVPAIYLAVAITLVSRLGQRART
ncbi:MAG: zinc ribbon domain-containing protein [Thermoanaerobaculia bacterium]